MSSHHIVKDNQEPALLLVDIADSKVELLNQLLEWSPQVAVTYHTLEFCHSLGIKIDFVFHTISEPIDNQYLMSKFPTIKLIICLNPIEDAVLHFRKNNQQSINIICNSIPDLPEDFKKVGIVFYNEFSKSYIINGTFTKWFTKGYKFVILGNKNSFNSSISIVFEYNNKNEFLTSESGLVKIVAKDNLLLTEFY